MALIKVFHSCVLSVISHLFPAGNVKYTYLLNGVRISVRSPVLLLNGCLKFSDIIFLHIWNVRLLKIDCVLSTWSMVITSRVLNMYTKYSRRILKSCNGHTASPRAAFEWTTEHLLTAEEYGCAVRCSKVLC
jgi:hypothetical protein